MGILVILLALGCLMFLAYRGLSLLLLAPAMAMLAVLLAEGGPLLASYTQVFMQATAETRSRQNPAVFTLVDPRRSQITVSLAYLAALLSGEQSACTRLVLFWKDRFDSFAAWAAAHPSAAKAWRNSALVVSAWVDDRLRRPFSSAPLKLATLGDHRRPHAERLSTVADFKYRADGSRNLDTRKTHSKPP